MKVIKKIIASVSACAIMAMSSAVSASAASVTVPCGGANVTGSLNVYSTSATASTSIDHLPGTVSVSIHGTYVKKGTSTTAETGNGNGSATGGCSATIYNGGGTWISVDSTHYGYYNGQSVTFYMHG